LLRCIYVCVSTGEKIARINWLQGDRKYEIYITGQQNRDSITRGIGGKHRKERER